MAVNNMPATIIAFFVSCLHFCTEEKLVQSTQRYIREVSSKYGGVYSADPVVAAWREDKTAIQTPSKRYTRRANRGPQPLVR